MAVYKLKDIFAGRYALFKLIGEGGFSEVWKAHDQMADDAVVALKIYAPEKGLDDHGVKQFSKEFSLTHNLAHPHLMKVYHFDISDGSPYLIMPYCQFGSLSNFLDDNGEMDERQIALIMCQIGSALEDLHSQDPAIIHHDIKPDNILIQSKEYYLLTDFGISDKVRHTLRKATAAMKSLTVAYAPPECFDRHPVTDAKSDIFSLGVTLYEMCTNSIPWGGIGGQSLLKGGHIPSLPDDYSNGLSKLLQLCMSVDRSKRPTASELQKYGKHFLENGNWDLSLKPVKPKVESSELSNRVRLFQSLTGVFVLVGIVLGIVAFRQASNLNEIEQESHELIETIQQKDTQISGLIQTRDALIEKDTMNSTKLRSMQEELDKYANRRPRAAQRNPQLNSYYTQAELQDMLNKISNPEIDLTVRNNWVNETESQFASGTTVDVVRDDSEMYNISGTALLNQLMKIPHRIEIGMIERNSENKIVKMVLTLRSRT